MNTPLPRKKNQSPQDEWSPALPLFPTQHHMSAVWIDRVWGIHSGQPGKQIKPHYFARRNQSGELSIENQQTIRKPSRNPDSPPAACPPGTPSPETMVRNPRHLGSYIHTSSDLFTGRQGSRDTCGPIGGECGVGWGRMRKVVSQVGMACANPAFVSRFFGSDIYVRLRWFFCFYVYCVVMEEIMWIFVEIRNIFCECLCVCVGVFVCENLCLVL